MALNEVQIKKAIKDIIKPIEDVKITLKESIFVNEILPLLMSDIDREIVIGRWLEICKSPYFSVDIVNEENEYLFTVPPLWARQSTRIDYDGRYSFYEIVSQTQMKSGVSPAKGDQFFNICSSYLIPKSQNKTDCAKMWEDILIKYGYETKDKDLNIESEEEFEFDDL